VISSVTAWFVQALKTARLAQLKTDHALFSRALSFSMRLQPEARPHPGDSNGVVTLPVSARPALHSRPPALLRTGNDDRQFNGGLCEHLMVKGAELSVSRRQTGAGRISTSVLRDLRHAHMGGEYRVWVESKKSVTSCSSTRATKAHQPGVGIRRGPWAYQTGGRTFTTALGALCLEVYYRYSEAL